MSVIEALQEARRKVAQAQDEARVLVKQVFAESTKDLFAKHPKLETFAWRQYTPYFNDGSPCEFSANIDEPMINGSETYDDNSPLAKTTYVQDGTRVDTGWGTRAHYVEVPNPDFDPELYTAYDAVRQFLGTFGDEDFEDMFGDHVLVTVSRDGGVFTEEYDHD